MSTRRRRPGPIAGLAVPWDCDETEICCRREGKMTVTRPDGETTSFGEGDLVGFPEGGSYTWKINGT